jgi:hypothetical protein
MVPTGAKRGRVVVALAAPLGQHVEAKRLGLVLAKETGLRISRNPDTARALDISFVTRERIPTGGSPEDTETSPRTWPSM